MRNAWKWDLGVLAFALVTFLIAMSFFGGFGCGGYTMMGRGMGWGPGMMGGWGMFGGIGMLLMLLIPLGLIALLIAGAVVLVRSLNTPRAVVPSNAACPGCGRPVQGDWTTCPYCGKPLA